MGLDLLEFTIQVEKAFEIHIPDADMVDLATPRRVVDYVAASLSAAANDVCRSQRAFYRLRKSLVDRVGCARSTIHVDTSLLELIPITDRNDIWEQVRHNVGMAKC